VRFLERNKQLLKADNLTIFQQDAFAFLNKKPKVPFDLILFFNHLYLMQKTLINSSERYQIFFVC
jgi:hypothetical protein